MRRKTYAVTGATALLALAATFVFWNQPKAVRSEIATKRTAVPSHERQGADDAHESQHVAPPQPAAADHPAEERVPAAPLPLNPATFLTSITGGDKTTARIPLPGGQLAIGRITNVRNDAEGTVAISGSISQPYEGSFYFLRQPLPNKAGPLVGRILFKNRDLAYRVYPTGADQTPELREVTADDVICRNNPREPEHALQNHPVPSTQDTPPSQNGIPPLQSFPGAQAVVYLDFDGESGTFTGWPDWGNEQPINAVASGMSNAQIIEAWKRLAEDFLPFNINITTIRSVYEAAPVTSRMHCIVTPTDTAAPGAGGVAYTSSFNDNDTRKVCWVYVLSGKGCAEAASHEIGHTLGLDHDGIPADEYYEGHGADPVGWAPIMGAGYYKNLTQWSKGEYANATCYSTNNVQQDDLAIITTDNNNVDYRVDDGGNDYASARFLDIVSGGNLSAVSGYNEGVIETGADVDAFKFTTKASGNLNLTIKPANCTTDANSTSGGGNLDIEAEILKADGSQLNPRCFSAPSVAGDNSPGATLAVANLPAGNYIVRISGAGRGDVLGTGYSDYGSLGTYLISGSITNAVYADQLSINENATNGAPVGPSAVASRVVHAGTKIFNITAGNTNDAFSINSSGVISVANSAALNYEALSTKWDDPATFELNVRITDTNNSATEDIRVIVAITDVDEAPVASAPQTVSLPETTPVGTVVATMAGSDPDRFDYLTYSITSGNVDGAFAIDPQTGVVTTTKNLAGTSSVVLTIQATDHFFPTSSTTTLTVATVRTIMIPANVGVILEPNMAPPTGGTPSYEWTQVNGSGSATFATPNASTCATTFSANGDYSLRLTLGNGSVNVVDDVAVQVGVQFSGTTYGTGVAGSFTKISNTSYTLTGRSSGIDENSTADGFYLLGQTFTADFDLRARVVSGTDISTTNDERAGLIVRLGTSGQANEVSGFIGYDTSKPEYGYWLKRTSTGGPNSKLTDTSSIRALPSWCRLSRTGTTVSAYFSEDGVNWGSPVGTMTISGTVRAGLCWSSDNTSTNGNVTFDNVSGLATGNIGPVVNAGSDQTVASSSANLAATLSDDGQPGAAPTANWVKVSGPGTITFSNSSAVNSTATASEPGVYLLRWIGNDTLVKTYDDVQLTFTTTYSAWATAKFGANASNPSIAGDNADPDKDGRTNLMEYALNSNPNAPDQSGIATDIETWNGQRYLRITVNKNSAATDVTIAAEVSPDLGSTSWVGGGSNVVVETNSTTQYVARDNIPISSAARRYIRAKVTRN